MNAPERFAPPPALAASFRSGPQMDNRRVLSVLIDNLEGMVFRCAVDERRTCLFASEGCRNLTGFGPEGLIGERGIGLTALVAAPDRDKVRRRVREAIETGERYRMTFRIECRDGSRRWVLERGVRVADEFGLTVLEGFVEDITEQVERQHLLVEAEARYRGLFENAVIGVFQSSVDGRYLTANAALARIYGYDSVEALVAELNDIDSSLYVRPGRRSEFKRLIQARGYVSGFESEVYRRDGGTIWITETAQAIKGEGGEVLYYQGTVEDISDRMHYRAQLEYQANHDALTGLPNRNLLRARLDRIGSRVAVAFIDLDNFKVINDSLGHAVGDKLLVAVAGRIKSCLRGIDTVARYGGDEFVLILHHVETRDALELVLGRVLVEVARPVRVDGHELQVSCSIGVVLPDPGEVGAERLLQHADAAMYSAKAAGRGAYAFYTPSLNAAAMERLQLEHALRRALECGEIDVHFQPMVDAKGHAVCFEALARWNSAEFGCVPPSRFIPLAKELRLIRILTGQVLDRACAAALRWSGEHGRGIGVSVNLCPSLLCSGDVVRLVAEALDRSGLPPELLELELTEGSLVDPGIETVERLRALKAMRVRLAVDDFGTGYSSLAYLLRFPLDILKIDRSFVVGAVSGSDEAILVRAVASLGRELGLRVVAEGIETEAQWQLMAKIGCDAFQGFLFSRPLDAESVSTWLEAASSSIAASEREQRARPTSAR